MIDRVTVDVLNYSNYMQVQVYAQGRISSSFGNWQQLQTASPSCVVLLLPGTITTLAVDTNSVCDSCQALQAEREGETHQHTGHSGGTL